MEKNIFGIWCGNTVFDRDFYKTEFDRLVSLKSEKKFFIKRSGASFKINKLIQKGTDSFELADFIKKSDKTASNYWTITVCYYSMLYLAKAAILNKRYETDDHYGTQIALGHLLVPGELEKEDFELLEQSYNRFPPSEDEGFCGCGA